MTSRHRNGLLRKQIRDHLAWKSSELTAPRRPARAIAPASASDPEAPQSVARREELQKRRIEAGVSVRLPDKSVTRVAEIRPDYRVRLEGWTELFSPNALVRV